MIKKNVDYFDIAGHLKMVDFDNIVVDDIVYKDDIIYKKYENKYLSLNSFNYKKEVELYTKDIDFSKDNLFIIIGFSNLKLLTELYEKSTDDTKIIIIEPDINLFKFMFENCDLTSLKNEKVIFISSNKLDDIYKNIRNFFVLLDLENLIFNIKYFINPNYYIYKKTIDDIVYVITTTVDMKIKSFGNCLEDMLNGFTNNYLNVDTYLETNKMDEVHNIYKDRPAIVVASGPSLDKNIHLLKEVKDKAVVIACDASYDVCMKYGVVPDAIASIERDEPTYTYYYKDKKYEKDVVLLGPGLLWPKIFEEFKGKKLITNKVNTGIDEWWISHFDNIQYINLGYSSANVAYSHARWLGCDPVILIGQDLAYTGGKKHSNDTHTEFEGDNNAKEAEGHERYVEDVFGEKVLTDSIYDLFRNWFEQCIQFNDYEYQTCVDATEGGAKIKNSKIMSFREAIDEYIKDIDYKDERLYYKLSDVNVVVDEYINKYREIIKSAKFVIKDLLEINKKAKKYTEKLIDIKNNVDIQSLKEPALKNIISKMNTGNMIIKFIKERKVYVTTYFNQIIKQSIISVKKIGNDITPETVEKNLDIQLKLMVLITNTSYELIGYYEKLIEHLIKRISEREQNENN